MGGNMNRYFSVPYCSMRGCVHHLVSNRCIKHMGLIKPSVRSVRDLHTPESCLVRHQVDVYQLDQLINGE